jgi:hypothetical protein
MTAGNTAPTHYAFTNTGVFTSWDGINFVVNSTANVSNFSGEWTLQTSSYYGVGNTTHYFEANTTIHQHISPTSNVKITPEIITVGNSTVNTTINSTSVTPGTIGGISTLTGFFTANNTHIASAGKHVIPNANGTYDLGMAAYRWGTVYTSDLSLNNGIGDWTIVEGEDDLFLYNNKKSKVYKFNLIEIDPSEATPKRS